jgi:hypothetical protein
MREGFVLHARVRSRRVPRLCDDERHSVTRPPETLRANSLLSRATLFFLLLCRSVHQSIASVFVVSWLWLIEWLGTFGLTLHVDAPKYIFEGINATTSQRATRATLEHW